MTAALWVYGAGVAPTRADHSDGNMSGQVNYWLVDEGQLRVCDNSSLITASQFNDGLEYWNDGLGWTALVNSCTKFGVELIDVPNGDCGYRPDGDPVGACADFPQLDPITGLPQVRELKVAPFLPNESPASDDVFFPFVIAHELGHNLGFAHILVPDPPPNCTFSIMQAPRCDTGFPTSLTQVDKDNYHDGYHADAVASFSGTPTSSNTIDFTWDGSDIHNEVAYLIERRDNCSGPWQPDVLMGKNESSETVTGLPSGRQGFQILPLTFADVAHQGKPSNEVCIDLPDLSGVYDILAHDGTENVSIFSCIARLDHDITTDSVTSSMQCNNDLPGLGETDDTPPDWCELTGACNPSEPGPDFVPGPPPPPPYTSMAPATGSGAFLVPGGFNCQARLSSLGQDFDDPCVIQTVCIPDVGSPAGIGPNIIFKAYIGDPDDVGVGGQTGFDGKSHGVVDIFYNQSNANCTGLSPQSSVDIFDFPVLAYLAYEEGPSVGPEPKAPWRNTSCGTPPCNPNPGWTVLDYDGDGCDD